MMALSVRGVPRLRLECSFPCALLPLVLQLSRLPGRAHGRSCGSWIQELRRQKAGNSEGFDPSCHWTTSISERAQHRVRDLLVMLPWREGSLEGGAAPPSPPSPCTNCSPLNQLSGNDSSYPGFPLESSLFLNWTPTTGLQLIMMYVLNSTA